MTGRFLRCSMAAAAAVAMAWLVSARVATQSYEALTPKTDSAQKAQTPSVPPAPRTADGHPDLSGRWGGGGGGGGIKAIDAQGKAIEYKNASEIKGAAKILARDYRARHGNPTYSERDSGIQQRYVLSPPLYKPEFWEKVQYLDVNGNVEDSNFHCMPAGVPRMGPPMRIIQSPKDVVFLYQTRNTWRVIPTDGRPHDPVNSQDQTYLGDSVGHWEGDTLVVDVVGFNEDSWLAWPGYFHTNEMRVIERLRRVGNTLTWQATVEDPTVLMEPWVMEPRTLRLNPASTPYVEDPPCLDEERQHLVTKERG